MINFFFADFISRVRVANSKNICSVFVFKTKFVLNVLSLFTKEGFIDSFFIVSGWLVLVKLKLDHKRRVFLFKNLKLVSTPGRRQFWNLKKLSCVYSYNNFSGFYIISSSIGLLTSSDALLNLRVGGEVFLKIFL